MTRLQKPRMTRWLRICLLVAAFAIPIAVKTVMVVASDSARPSAESQRLAFLRTAKIFDPHVEAGALAASPLGQAVMKSAQTATAATPQAALALRGQILFESNTMTVKGERCSTCHSNGTENAAIGTINHPRGIGDFKGPRDPISLFDVGKTAPYRWAGEAPTLEGFDTGAVLSFFKDSATAPVAVIADRVAALSAYLDTLTAPQTSFDLGTMSPAALQGQELFEGKGNCMSCHGGPLLTDNSAHNTNVPHVPGGTDVGNPSQPGAFNTPGLRDVRNTAPYMHNGVFGDLHQVVEFYNTSSSISPLFLTPQEIDDIVAYLDTL